MGPIAISRKIAKSTIGVMACVYLLFVVVLVFDWRVLDLYIWCWFSSLRDYSDVSFFV